MIELVNNSLLRKNIFQQNTTNMQTWIFNRIHKGVCSLADVSSRKDAEGIGISRINQNSLKYKTKLMNAYITRAVIYQ